MAKEWADILKLKFWKLVLEICELYQLLLVNLFNESERVRD